MISLESFDEDFHSEIRCNGCALLPILETGLALRHWCCSAVTLKANGSRDTIVEEPFEVLETHMASFKKVV